MAILMEFPWFSPCQCTFPSGISQRSPQLITRMVENNTCSMNISEFPMISPLNPVNILIIPSFFPVNISLIPSKYPHDIPIIPSSQKVQLSWTQNCDATGQDHFYAKQWRMFNPTECFQIQSASWSHDLKNITWAQSGERWTSGRFMENHYGFFVPHR